ncbi:hypothetical protein TNCV_5090921 [Trichonephila clavipes]|nr:hypothetical protein TNCV_5090921 [Trichonephila clavipes]
MTNIELRNIIIGSKDYEEEFVRDQLSVILEERFERESEEKNRQAARNRGGKKIARQHAIQQLRWESELNELRLEIESIRSNVKRTSCAEDRKKTSSNYRISIGRAEEHVRKTSPAVLMAEATIPVTTPIKEEKGMDDLRVVYVKVKGEQEMVNAVIDTGAQMPVVRPDVVEGQSINNRGSIQITSAFGSMKWVNQEVVTDLLPETQSLLNVPNGDLVAVKINGSNVQTNGQGIKESKAKSDASVQSDRASPDLGNDKRAASARCSLCSSSVDEATSTSSRYGKTKSSPYSTSVMKRWKDVIKVLNSRIGYRSGIVCALSRCVISHMRKLELLLRQLHAIRASCLCLRINRLASCWDCGALLHVLTTLLTKFGLVKSGYNLKQVEVLGGSIDRAEIIIFLDGSNCLL